jgi:hypothetical protein
MLVCSLLIAAGADLGMQYTAVFRGRPFRSISELAKIVKPNMRKLHRLLETGELVQSKACAGCGAPEFVPGVKLKVCARCKAVHYCRDACQREHWKEHKPQCAKPAGPQS